MKKTIVFVLGGLGKGGAERVVTNIANSYSRDGWRVVVYLLLNSDVAYEIDPSVEIKFINPGFSSYALNAFGWVVGLRSNFSKDKPDICLSFFGRINILSLIATRGLGIRVAVSERNDPRRDGRGWGIRLLTRLLYPLSACVIFQTHEILSLFSGSIQKKSVVIRNPVTVDEISRPCELANKIVTAGRLVPQKNHSLLIDAFSIIRKTNKSIELHIYGDGPLRGELQNKINRLGLSDAAFLKGGSDFLHREIIDAKVFVLSSDFEGLSNALMEAMALGIPCISTNCAGSKELINDYQTGILVPVNSVFGLAFAINLLLANKNLCDEISERAKMQSYLYDSKNVVREWKRVLDGSSLCN